MDSTKLLKGLFKKINSENNFVDGNGGGYTQLTPHLSLVVSILYMMVADGEISDQESSQLQSVIGKNENVLKRALNYVETTKIEQFLKDVPAVLDSQDSLCILMNVCDSIMADGQLAKIELNLFDQLTSALGHSKKSFRSYFNTISIKNKKSVLGSFENIISTEQLTPQMALAASVLYMMSADGSMAEEEIGQLNVVIGRSEFLLQDSLKYVRKIKFQQFIKDAAAILNPAQQLCILTNVCDSMMSDGEVVDVEMDLFRRMLTAFGFSEEKFQPYFTILSRKNKKPVEVEDEDSYGGAIPARFKKREEDGVIHDRKMSRNDSNIRAPEERDVSAAENDEIGERTEQSELSIIINRKMHDNLSKMAETIEDENGIQDITDNANSKSNNEAVSIRVQDDTKSFADLTQIEDSVHYLDKESSKDSIHYLDNDKTKGSRHNLGSDDVNSAANTISLHQDGAAPSTPQSLNKHKKKSGSVKQRALKDKLSLVHGKDKHRKNKSPSDHRIITDQEFDFDGSPLQVRMTVVQSRTDEINQSLDMLETVSEADFTKRGQILNMITLSLAPLLTLAKTDSGSSNSVLVNNSISIANNEEFSMAANHSALESSAHAVGIDSFKAKIATLFTALILAHGLSSFGESSAQSSLIQNGNLAADANVTLQAVAVQQTMYKLAADDLDSSIAKENFFSSEQQELAKKKLAGYLTKIEMQESAPATKDGKKELSAAHKSHNELEAVNGTKLQWFSLSNAVLIFGIGLALCGFFFRSRFIFYSANLTAVVGTVFTLNGYFLFF